MAAKNNKRTTGTLASPKRHNTTYTEGTVLRIFSKDTRAHCERFVRMHQPKCKATNASVLCSLHFKQSYTAMEMSERYLVVRVLSSLHTKRNRLKRSEDSIEIILASHHCDLCDYDFGSVMISCRLETCLVI